MDDFSAKQVGDWVDELINVGLIRQFKAEEDGDLYWHITGWDRHQKIDRPSFKHPAPPPFDSTSTRRASVAEDSTSARRAPPPGVEGSGVEGSGVDARSPKARAPTSMKKAKTSMPEGFAVSDSVRSWASANGFSDLELHLEVFRGKCAAKGYTYVNWDAAFQEAIRADWAKLRATAGNAPRRPVLHADDVFEVPR